MNRTMNTTHGLMNEAQLARSVGFEDRPNEFVVWVEWRMPACIDPCPVCAHPDNPQPVNGQVLVRRDAHCILKDATVGAQAIAAALG